MSWDSYIDNVMGHSAGSIDKVCIAGLDGSMWTTSAHANALKGSCEEYKKIAQTVKSGDPTPFQASGCMLEGEKYNYLRSDGEIFLFKKKDHGALTIHKTQTAMVIAHCAEGQSHGNANKAVATVAEYLVSLGM